jgi:hypothetical protein
MRCVRIAPAIVQVNKAAAIAQVLGSNSKIGQITSRLPVKITEPQAYSDPCEQFYPENDMRVEFARAKI